MKNLLLFGALVGIPIVSSAQTGFDFNSAMLLAENYLNSKENQFCYVVYYDLESSEIAEMMITINKVTFVQANPEALMPRLTSPCSVFIGRDPSEEFLFKLKFLAPQAYRIILSPRSAIEIGRSDFLTSFVQADNLAGSAKIDTFDCQGLVDRNFVKLISDDQDGSMYILKPLPDLWTLNKTPKGQCYHGAAFDVSVFGHNPYIVQNGESFSGIDVDLITIMTKQLNINVDIFKASTWGTVKNGTWRGIVGDVQQGRAQVGMGSLIMSAARQRAVDYTHFTYIYDVSLFLKKPEPSEPFLKILDPLSLPSWMSFLISTLIVSFGAVFLLKSQPDLRKNAVVMSTTIDKVVFSLFFMLVQPHSLGHKSWINLMNKTTSGALSLSVWFIAVTFFNFFYISNLRASLLLVTYPKPIDTVQEALDANVRMYLTGGSSVIATMGNSLNPSFRKAYQLSADNDWFYKVKGKIPQDKIDGILHDNHALMSHDRIFKRFAKNYYVEHGEQPFHFMKEKIFIVTSGFVVPKEMYMLKRSLDFLLSRMNEAGLIRNVESNYMPPQVNDVKEKKEQVMDMWHFLSTFFFYGIFLGISCIVFGLEWFSFFYMM